MPLWPVHFRYMTWVDRGNSAGSECPPARQLGRRRELLRCLERQGQAACCCGRQLQKDAQATERQVKEFLGLR